MLNPYPIPPKFGTLEHVNYCLYMAFISGSQRMRNLWEARAEQSQLLADNEAKIGNA
jgi:hypothetical protein